MTRGTCTKAYSLRKPTDKLAADLPEERKCNEVLGPTKLQKELLALKNTNRLLEEQLQSTGGMAIVELTQQLEERNRDLADAEESLKESKLQLQQTQRDLDAAVEGADKLRLELVDQKQINDEFASVAIAISRSDVDQLREEVVALRADNQVLEQQALQASADAANASLNEAQVRQKLAASIGNTATSSEALAELELQLAQRDVEIADHGIVIMQKKEAHARMVAEVAIIKREAAANKAGVAKALELLAARDAELAEARHQIFSSTRSTHATKEIRRQTNQHTVVVHQSSELDVKDAIIARLELTLAKQEARLAAVKVSSTNVTSGTEIPVVTPVKQSTKPKRALLVAAQGTVSTANATMGESTESTPAADCVGVGLDAASTKSAAATTSEVSTDRPHAALLAASSNATILSSSPGADWSIFD